jgi:hypothetical protein
MTKIVVPITSATTISAMGHAMRWPFADFDIRRSMLGVERFCSGAIEQEQDHEQRARRKPRTFTPEKITAPHTR